LEKREQRQRSTAADSLCLARDPSPFSRCRRDQHDSDKAQTGDDQPDDQPPLDRPLAVIWIPPEYELDQSGTMAVVSAKVPVIVAAPTTTQSGQRLPGMVQPSLRSCQRFGVVVV
jgi:hypothetical protein